MNFRTRSVRPLSGAFLASLVLACAAPANAVDGAAPAAPAASGPSAPARASAPAVPVAAERSNALDLALDSVRVDEIKADVYFLASDQLGGRDTPSLGLQIAARYLRARLERLGWQPGAKDGYFYTYPLSQKRLDEAACGAKATAGDRTIALELGSDYFLAGSSDAYDSVLAARAVWCGSGEEKEFIADSLQGKWAVCLDRGESAFRITRAAKKAGAAGVVLVESLEAKESYASRYGKMEELRRGGVEYPRKADAKECDRRPTERTPRILLGRGTFERLLALGGKTEAALALGADLGFDLAETRKLDAAGTVEVENVCGFWPGSDPVLKNEVILVTAHYDHVGTSRGQVYNGADDNGSGTSGLLALAQALARHGPMRRSVMLMWVSGEEKGLWGSKAWTDAPWLPEGCKAVCDVNIDMIGRNAPDKLLITPTAARAEYNGLVRLAESLAPLEGFPKLGSADEYYQRSDHYNFAKKGIPAAFLFSDVHEDYHKPTDDPEKIDNDKIRRVVRLVLRMLDGLQKDELGV
ncbi:MAG: M28 family peptidase [Planctomycetes bacterium]|nr:M28 family peptidase [Planctomycetota bacterium]